MTFLQAVFISVVILHQDIIWVTFLSYPSVTFSIIGMLLLAATATQSFSTKRFHRAFLLTFFGFVATVLSQFGADLGSLGSPLASVIAYVVLTLICLIVVFRWKSDQERLAIKVLVVVSSLMSLLGFAAWLMVTATWATQDLIDPAHLVDISQFTEGKLQRIERQYFETANEFGIFENTYSFPYYMGLVLTNSYLYELFGFQFFRASSWYTEPVSVWLMLIPAIILTYYGSYFEETKRRILLVVQFCFVLASFSLSIIISLFAIYITHKLLHAFGHAARFGEEVKTAIRVLIIIGTLSLLGVYAFDYVPGSDLARNIIADKILYGEYTDLGRLFDPVVLGGALLYFLLITLVYCWGAAKAKDRDLMSFSLVVLCFLIVSLKGDFYHLSLSPGFFIFYFLMLKHRDLAPRPFPGLQQVTLPSRQIV